MKLALLTGGGDCAGLNAAIRAVVHAANREGYQTFGIQTGFHGLISGKCKRLTLKDTDPLLHLGGTILGGSRINPLKDPEGVKKALAFFKREKFDALISIGGEGTLNIAAAFSKQGLPIICIPKTIDNDTWGTDFTIGFDTAVQIATEAIDRLQTTAESHQRVIILEVMGRHAGWIAAYSGIAGGAHATLIPEEIFPIEKLCAIIHHRARVGKKFSIFVVSEDARIEIEEGKILKTPIHHDEYGDIKLGGIGEALAIELRHRTACEVRVTVLGHVQRGGSPSAADRILATRLGVFAVGLVKEKNFGKMAVLKGNKIQAIPIEKAAGKLKTVDTEIKKVLDVFME